MEEDQGYILTRDRIFIVSPGSPLDLIHRSRDRRRPPPIWATIPNFAIWTATPQAAAPRRRHRSKCAVFDATGGEPGQFLEQVTGRSRSGEECAICLNDFRDDERLRAMPCSHAFHYHCISQWLRRNAVCPLCRRPMFPDPTREEKKEEVAPELEEEDIEWVDGAIETS